MAKRLSGSVAPKERINIQYKPAIGDAKEGIELPFKMMVLGDFSKQMDDRPIEEREPIDVNPSNLDTVMESMNLNVDFTVPNKMNDNGGDIKINYDIKAMSDFSPDKILQEVPELKKVLELREALKSLKGPLGNVPEMRRTIQGIVSDKGKRDEIMKQIGVTD